MLTTYLGNDQLKRDFLAQIALHEAQDALIKGTYGELVGETFKGCAIGCSLHSLNILQGKSADDDWRTSDHTRYEAELGLPTWLAYLEDHVFESLPDDLSRTWPRRFAEAIPVGATVSDGVLARILWWSLTSDEFGIRHATDDVEIHSYIDVIATALDAEANGTVTADQREAAARAAWDAWDARAARDAKAARAARAAWDAWDARAARAARDAWDARAARAAWAAWDARAAWDKAQPSAAPKKAPRYHVALSEFVLEQLRTLPSTIQTAYPPTSLPHAADL